MLVCDFDNSRYMQVAGRDPGVRYLPAVNTMMIRAGYPEAGGGGASAALDHAPLQASEDVADGDAGAAGGGGEAPPAAGDDDDGGDDEGDPDRRRSPLPSSLRGKHRNATATAGALLTPPKDIALWRLPTVLAHVPISRSGWWAGVKAGRYPAPVRISTRCVAWKSEDIRALINSL